MSTDTTTAAPYFNHDETMAYCVQQAASAMDDIAAAMAKIVIESMGLDPHPLLTPYLSQPTICGIPADGVEAVYWGNELIWERPKKEKPSLP